MLVWEAISDQVGALDTNMLFEMLERIVCPRGKAIECSTMHMAWRDKTIRQHRRRRNGVVLREPVQWIG